MSSINTDIRAKIDRWFEAHESEMIGDLGRLVAVKSVRGAQEEGKPYGAGPREALALAGSMLEERGFAVSVFEDMIITADLGPEPVKMGILAHLDVVDAGDGWETDPYELTVRDGRLYGRGVIDNKGPSVASMYAMYCIRDLAPQLKHGCRLILGSGEETGCDDIELYTSKVAPPPNVFTPDAGYPLINIEKGRAAIFFGASWEKDASLPRVVSVTGGKTMNVVPNRAEAVVEGFSVKELEMFCMVSSAQTGTTITSHAGEQGDVITVEGKAAHASMPEHGVNAQTALLDMLANMPFAKSSMFSYIRALNRLFPHGDYNGKALGIAMSDEKTGELTASFGVLRMTETDFTANFDGRTPACADEADLLGMIKSALERECIEMTNSRMSTCHHTPEDSEFIRTLLGVYTDYTGNPGHCLSMGGQTYVHDIPGGVAFGVEEPGVDGKIHGANEGLSIKWLTLSAKMFAQAVAEMCGG